jgi:hypothetical protein
VTGTAAAWSGPAAPAPIIAVAAVTLVTASLAPPFTRAISSAAISNILPLSPPLTQLVFRTKIFMFTSPSTIYQNPKYRAVEGIAVLLIAQF